MKARVVLSVAVVILFVAAWAPRRRSPQAVDGGESG
jgi:hypothetical protein